MNVTHEQAREVLQVAQTEGKETEEAQRRLTAAVNAMDEASEIKRKVRWRRTCLYMHACAAKRAIDFNSAIHPTPQAFINVHSSRNFIVVHEFDLGERPEPLHKAGVVQVRRAEESDYMAAQIVAHNHCHWPCKYSDCERYRCH